jgi:Tryptophan 2,3-dioxygenase
MSEDRNTYSRYLQLEKLISAQVTPTGSDDELLFIIMHQSHELWFKQAIHELDCATRALMAGTSGKNCLMAFKRLARVQLLTGLAGGVRLVDGPAIGRSGAEPTRSCIAGRNMSRLIHASPRPFTPEPRGEGRADPGGAGGAAGRAAEDVGEFEPAAEPWAEGETAGHRE